jgi:hypothetical protein
VGSSLLEKNTTYYMFFITLHRNSDIEYRCYINNIKGALALNLLNKQGVGSSLPEKYLLTIFIYPL